MLELTQPKVYLIAAPEDTGEMDQFLEDEGFEWDRKDVPFAEKLAEFAGRLCYLAWKKKDGTFVNQNLSQIREDPDQYFANILESRHGSVLEHGGLTFLFSNVSRVFTHELVRHRAGCGYSQTSGRFILTETRKFWIPPEIMAEPAARIAFEEGMKSADRAVDNLIRACRPILEGGDFKQKKAITSAIRRIAPVGWSNHILLSANHRALRGIIEQRTSQAAEVEIRTVFGEVAERMKNEFPNMYQDLDFFDGQWSFRNSKV